MKIKYDIFISHKQYNGGQLALNIKNELLKKDKNLKIFLDVDDLNNIHDLENNIKCSNNLLFIITDGVFERDFVILELKTALKNNKNIITVWDKEHCPELPKKEVILKDVSSVLDIKTIIWQSENYLRETIINEILKRIKKSNILECLNKIEEDIINLNINLRRIKNNIKQKYIKEIEFKNIENINIKSDIDLLEEIKEKLINTDINVCLKEKELYQEIKKSDEYINKLHDIDKYMKEMIILIENHNNIYNKEYQIPISTIIFPYFSSIKHIHEKQIHKTIQKNKEMEMIKNQIINIIDKILCLCDKIID